MKSLLSTTKGSVISIHGENFSPNGSKFFCLFASLLVFQNMLKLPTENIQCLFKHMVFKFSKISTNYNFNDKELPDRAAYSAHWSGPFVAAR